MHHITTPRATKTGLLMWKSDANSLRNGDYPMGDIDFFFTEWEVTVMAPAANNIWS